MVKICWLTKIVFQVFFFLFLELKGELALAYESYAGGILIVFLIGNNDPIRVTPPTSKG